MLLKGNRINNERLLVLANTLMNGDIIMILDCIWKGQYKYCKFFQNLHSPDPMERRNVRKAPGLDCAADGAQGPQLVDLRSDAPGHLTLLRGVTQALNGELRASDAGVELALLFQRVLNLESSKKHCSVMTVFDAHSVLATLLASWLYLMFFARNLLNWKASI
jgi:hypothetical protein